MKKFKKVLAAVLAGTMVLSSMLVSAFADDTSYEAVLNFADANWGNGHWTGDDTEVKTTVTGDGTYTITMDVASDSAVSGFIVACVDIIGLLKDADGNNISINDSDVKITSASVKADGTLVADSYVYGDTEEKGNLRIEFYNAYGPTNADTNAAWSGGDFVGEGGKCDADTYADVAATTTLEFTFTVEGLGGDTATGDSSTTALVLVAVAALAVVATVSVKKFAAER